MKKLLMFCGIAAAIVYVGTVVLGGMIRPGYSHISEAISELVADGAPNRSLLSSLFLIYNISLTLFGIGLFFKSKDRSPGKLQGINGSLVLIVVGIAGLLMELAFPQDPGGTPTTFAGTMHFVMAGIASFGTIVALLFLAFWFRNFPDLKGYFVYSVISAAITFISGGLTAAALATHHPMFGLIERITIGTFITWLFIIGRKMVQLERDPSRQLHIAMMGTATKSR